MQPGSGSEISEMIKIQSDLFSFDFDHVPILIDIVSILLHSPATHSTTATNA